MATVPLFLLLGRTIIYPLQLVLLKLHICAGGLTFERSYFCKLLRSSLVILITIQTMGTVPNAHDISLCNSFVRRVKQRCSRQPLTPYSALPGRP